MHGYCNGSNYGSMFLSHGSLIYIVIVVLVIAAIYFIIKGSKNNNQENMKVSSTREALSILDKRYANGEIDKDDYNEKKDNLTR
ncbi:MAG: SHOCT domain-containing protein [Erysipelotrichales bacterium]